MDCRTLAFASRLLGENTKGRVWSRVGVAGWCPVSGGPSRDMSREIYLPVENAINTRGRITQRHRQGASSRKHLKI